jgi:hypothetical protein
LAALAFFMFPRHTEATSSRLVFTHIRAMFSQTDSLPNIRNVFQPWGSTKHYCNNIMATAENSRFAEVSEEFS